MTPPKRRGMMYLKCPHHPQLYQRHLTLLNLAPRLMISFLRS